jgi:hypothetical protein
MQLEILQQPKVATRSQGLDSMQLEQIPRPDVQIPRIACECCTTLGKTNFNPNGDVLMCIFVNSQNTPRGSQRLGSDPNGSKPTGGRASNWNNLNIFGCANLKSHKALRVLFLSSKYAGVPNTALSEKCDGLSMQQSELALFPLVNHKASSPRTLPLLFPDESNSTGTDRSKLSSLSSKPRR